MRTLSRQEIESTMRVQVEPGATYGRMELVVPVYERAFEVEVWVADGQAAISDKTVATLNDVAALTQDARERITGLLYEDALRTAREVAFGDPNPPADPPPSGILARLFPPRKKYRFVELPVDDPRHPCYFANGVADVEQKVKWVGIRIDENQALVNRFALIDCYPVWEEEHGVAIVLRNGVPVGVGSYDVDLDDYDGTLG